MWSSIVSAFILIKHVGDDDFFSFLRSREPEWNYTPSAAFLLGAFMDLSLSCSREADY